MKKLFSALIVVALVTVGIGFYRGWFALSTPRSAAGSDEVNVNLTTNTGKIKQDAAKVKEKAAELTGSATDVPAKPGVRPAATVQPTDAPSNDGPSTAGETSSVKRIGN